MLCLHAATPHHTPGCDRKAVRLRHSHAGGSWPCRQQLAVRVRGRVSASVIRSRQYHRCAAGTLASTAPSQRKSTPSPPGLPSTRGDAVRSVQVCLMGFQRSSVPGLLAGWLVCCCLLPEAGLDSPHSRSCDTAVSRADRCSNVSTYASRWCCHFTRSRCGSSGAWLSGSRRSGCSGSSVARTVGFRVSDFQAGGARAPAGCHAVLDTSVRA